MVEPLAAAAAGFASVDECRLVALRTVDDPRGSLTIVEAERDIPFPIARVPPPRRPAGGRRGGHAHRRPEQILIAVAGSFAVVLDDGAARRRVRLDDPRAGVHIPPGVWRERDSFTTEQCASCSRRCRTTPPTTSATTRSS
jgi:hypothetical protein